MLQNGSIFAQSPSFNSYSSDNFAQIAAKVCEEFVDDRVQLGLEPLRNEEENHDDDEIAQVQEEEEKDDHLLEQQQEEEEKADEDEEDESEFEFSFLSGDGVAISADEIFANGQIRPVYPIFNRDLLFAGGKDHYDEDDSKQRKKNSSLRKLFIGEREEDDGHSCSSSEADVDELDNLPAGTYCVWKPKQQSSTASSPDTCKKSKSTGSSSSSASRSAATTAASVSKRWRFRDFLFRSNSDGKDTFVFLTPSSGTSTNMKNRKEEKLAIEEKLEKVVVSGNKVAAGKGKLKSGAAAATPAEVSAHEIHYVRNRALKENDRKKSYLPYRQDLVGFFANVNGLNRNLHPF